MEPTTILIVYGKSNCPQCVALKHRLAADEIPYTYVNVETMLNPEYFHSIKPVGVRSFPVPFISKGREDMRYIKPEDCTIMDEDIASMVLDF